MMKENLKRHVISALFAALTFAATMAVRIPTPGTNGYIHPGDALVILSGVILGPSAGFLAAGIGSALADLLGGYFVYAPITFVIKGLVALLCGLLFQKAGTHPKLRYSAVAAGGIVDILLVAVGYCLCESFLYGTPAAIAGIPANLVQGISGLIISLILYPVLSAIPDVRQLMPPRHSA